MSRTMTRVSRTPSTTVGGDVWMCGKDAARETGLSVYRLMGVCLLRGVKARALPGGAVEFLRADIEKLKAELQAM